ncbi:sulfonate transport system substrate-binding protein [Novosphingobium chloroacetimidivorans]|uniref:Sulfonate transport system substrate-binding protein n=1 Tax=Novosphingobium chloroacetimidivorans TaxID=1428314 RepID=A0A7W7K9Z0_9SPHN|nr:ABC transporter substrate-binding protein [Novosphingobium chloroacetimidivorans]MBB4858926.1 sulfonate transport system substrate-binding protein [Novosphingobium chloroacetimidivorans]
MALRSIRGRDLGTIISIALVVLAFIPLLVHLFRGDAAQAAGLSLDAPIPDKVPAGTTLVVGDPLTQKVLERNGWLKELPFKVQFAQITGGPGVTEAFQAKALDIGSAANIPPIHGVWVGIPVKIVAWRFRTEPWRYPLYTIGTAPGSSIHDVADLRGKRIAYSPGQAQGFVVLSTLAKAGIRQEEVTLVDLPAATDTYIGALAARQIDAAPIGAGLQARRYLSKYGADGAKVIGHGSFRDDPSVLYVRTETLRDPAKAAAIQAYVKLWALAQVWIDTHPKEWAELYYVQDQGLSRADADLIIRESGRSDIPRDWTQAITVEQQTIDFMAREMDKTPFPAADIFDRRFERVAADAIGRS